MRNIIWDWNGTLVDDAPIGLDILNDMLAKRGRETITLDFYREIYQFPVEPVYERLGFNLKDEPFEELSFEWHGRYRNRLQNAPLHVDAKATLRDFKVAGKVQSILSALPHDLLMASIEHHQIEEYFSHVHGLRDMLARSKIENGRELMKNLAADPDETIIIGDSTHDVETAKALGISCVLVARGAESATRLNGHGCMVLNDFSTLAVHLLSKD